MEYKITSPRHISAVINLPSSKSISNRVLVINALSGNVCGISNVADCDDTAVMLKSLSEGAERAGPLRPTFTGRYVYAFSYGILQPG